MSTRALITGASSGVGLATARMIHERGGSVAMVARRADVLEEVVAELGDRAIALPADVSDPDAVAAAVAAAFDALGDIDLVVNSAGVDGPAPLEDLDARKWQTTIGVNLSGSFYVAREAALRMTHGSIVNLGSELSSIGMGLFVDYCASKAGVIGLTKAMAAELAPRGIRVNVVCPGPIDTPMMESELAWFPDPEAVRIEAINRVPLKRWATPEEVAEAVLFMASATFATGACLALDGGTTAI
jgi:NAD(P)-dependent dehydrogenase (short-subunit alcohol dehydrogenase family)